MKAWAVGVGVVAMVATAGCETAAQRQSAQTDIDRFAVEAKVRPQRLSDWQRVLREVNEVNGGKGVGVAWLTSVLGKPDLNYTDGRAGNLIVYWRRAINDRTGQPEHLVLDHAFPSQNTVLPTLLDFKTEEPIGPGDLASTVGSRQDNPPQPRF